MKAFIVACGHSGTTWLARALGDCTDLDARHESMRYTVGQDFGGVEVNANLWRLVPEIWDRYPETPVLHVVRDGRKVVRTIMHRKPREWFGNACVRWARWNTEIMEHVTARYRLEDLTESAYQFRKLAKACGASTVSRVTWQDLRDEHVNRTRSHRFPEYDRWGEDEQALFWDICGPTMEACGYGD